MSKPTSTTPSGRGLVAADGSVSSIFPITKMAEAIDFPDRGKNVLETEIPIPPGNQNSPYHLIYEEQHIFPHLISAAELRGVLDAVRETIQKKIISLKCSPLPGRKQDGWEFCLRISGEHTRLSDYSGSFNSPNVKAHSLLTAPSEPADSVTEHSEGAVAASPTQDPAGMGLDAAPCSVYFCVQSFHREQTPQDH